MNLLEHYIKEIISVEDVTKDKYIGKFSVELSTDKNKSFIVKGA